MVCAAFIAAQVFDTTTVDSTFYHAVTTLLFGATVIAGHVPNAAAVDSDFSVLLLFS